MRRKVKNTTNNKNNDKEKYTDNCVIKTGYSIKNIKTANED